MMVGYVGLVKCVGQRLVDAATADAQRPLAEKCW